MDTLVFSHVLQHREASKNILCGFLFLQGAPRCCVFPPRCVRGVVGGCSDWLGFFTLLTFTGITDRLVLEDGLMLKLRFHRALAEFSQSLVWFGFPPGRRAGQMLIAPSATHLEKR